MIGDRERTETARAAIELRRLRSTIFPSELFDEYAWSLLLHTFICHVENKTISAEELYAKSGMTSSLGRRWLNHLVSDGQIESHDDGRDIHLSARSIAAMRKYLDIVRSVGSTALLDND